MPFAIITTDKPGCEQVRVEHQTAHKKYLDDNKHRLLAAGAMLRDDAVTAHGGILLVDTDNREEAEEFVRNDPFSKAGLFESLMITRWRKAFFDGERLVDL
ncbi:MAG: YciI family protein [Akkermansiaceae bacterium]|nr:YciI family protein [Roseibacillus sp.]